MTTTDNLARFVQRAAKAQAAINKLGAGPPNAQLEIERLRAINAELLAALKIARRGMAQEIKRGYGIFSDEQLARVDAAIAAAKGDTP